MSGKVIEFEGWQAARRAKSHGLELVEGKSGLFSLVDPCLWNQAEFPREGETPLAECQKYLDQLDYDRYSAHIDMSDIREWEDKILAADGAYPPKRNLTLEISGSRGFEMDSFDDGTARILIHTDQNTALELLENWQLNR